MAVQRRLADMDEATIKHLELIQGVITRMAQNSFTLKALSVTLSAGVLAFMGAARDAAPATILAAAGPVAVFWFLDAYYLRLERLFRRLYDAVRKGESGEPFAMDFRAFEEAEQPVTRIALSTSGLWFYAPVLAALIVIGLLLAGA